MSLLAVAVGLGCNLEAALGVDGDGSTSMTTVGGPGGPGTGESDATGEDPTIGDSTADPTTGDSADSSGSGLPPTDCSGQSLRVATFNIKSVDTFGSDEYLALVDVIGRVDADIICLQEVLFYEVQELSSLAETTGYSQIVQANEPPAIGGDFTNACLGRPNLSLVGSYEGSDLSDDPGANDVGRNILVVQADLTEAGGAPCRLGLVTLHLKSGQEELDWFRRQVEAERVAQAVAQYQAANPDDPMVIMGDLNESFDDPALGTVFPDVPVGLPASYDLGSDIEFPLTYQPFDTLTGLGFTMAGATQEDTVGVDETFGDDFVRLDYVLYSGAELSADEVYNSCRDNGVDDPPQGNWVAKAGEPLSCGVSQDASDHFPVLVDLVLP